MAYVIAGVAGVVAIVLWIIDIKGKRAEVLPRGEERLDRYTSDHGIMFTDFQEQEHDHEAAVRALEHELHFMRKSELDRSKHIFGRHIRRRLARANLPLTIGEYFAVRELYAVMGFAAVSVLSPQAGQPAAVIAGILGFFLPSWLLTIFVEHRQSQIQRQLPYALELWSTLSNEFTVSQSISMLAEYCPEPIASEFRRVSMETQIGIPQEDAFHHLIERIPDSELDLALEAVIAQQTVGGSLREMLRAVHTYGQRLKEIRSRNGYLVYFSDLMFPLVMGIIFSQWVIFEGYFESMTQRSAKTIFTGVVYAIITLAVLIVSDVGKRLRWVERRFNLRGRPSAAIGLSKALRIASVLLFIYAHTLDFPPAIIGWAWFMFFCIESIVRVFSLFSLVLVVIGVSLTTPGIGQLDWTGLSPLLEAVFHPTLAMVVLQLSCLSMLLAGVIAAALRMANDRDSVQQRLAEYGFRDEFPVSLEEVELSLSLADRVIAPFFERLAGLLSQLAPSVQISILQQKAAKAGKPMGHIQIAFQCFLSPVFFGAGVLLYSVSWGADILLGSGLAFAAMIGGYWLGVADINNRIVRRREQIENRLPDALFVLELWLLAGASIDRAMSRISEKWDDELGQVFGRILTESQLGYNRVDTLNNINQELQLEGFSYLSAAIIRFRQMGWDTLEYVTRLREQWYRDQETTILNDSNRYRFWHDFAWHFLLWIGLILWLLGPLLIAS